MHYEKVDCIRVVSTAVALALTVVLFLATLWAMSKLPRITQRGVLVICALSALIVSRGFDLNCLKCTLNILKGNYLYLPPIDHGTENYFHSPGQCIRHNKRKGCVLRIPRAPGMARLAHSFCEQHAKNIWIRALW